MSTNPIPPLYDSGLGERFSRRVGEQAPDSEYAIGWGCVSIIPVSKPKRAPWWKPAFVQTPTQRKAP